MTETSTPDPGDDKPSQAEGGPEDQSTETPAGPAADKPSQAEGDEGDADA